MGFEVRTIAAFEKDFKKLSKKYPSLKSDLFKLIGQLEANPFLGTSLGKFFIKLDLVYQAKEKVNQLAQE
jgi:mRNA-degrading endonuclease RelE of RelBE toxin-antitoxin system